MMTLRASTMPRWLALAALLWPFSSAMRGDKPAGLSEDQAQEVQREPSTPLAEEIVEAGFFDEQWQFPSRSAR